MSHGLAQSSTLADILERVLDKGIVIAGDITINVGEVELLSIKIRLLVASVERAQAMGINWWQHDPSLSQATAHTETATTQLEKDNQQLRLELENAKLRAELEALRAKLPKDGSKDS